jgi:hypothetical protein
MAIESTLSGVAHDADNAGGRPSAGPVSQMEANRGSPASSGIILPWAGCLHLQPVGADK